MTSSLPHFQARSRRLTWSGLLATQSLTPGPEKAGFASDEFYSDINDVEQLIHRDFRDTPLGNPHGSSVLDDVPHC
jgi:hypothetical protein